MPVHGRALSKSFLVYKRIMDGNMANQQSALPDPKATCDPATADISDIEFELLDVENDIVAVATVLAERARSVTSFAAGSVVRVGSCESAQIIAKAPV